MGRPKNKADMFCQSLYMNNRTYLQYYNRLTELALSMFEWKNLPDTIDPRFLEMCLLEESSEVGNYALDNSV